MLITELIIWFDNADKGRTKQEYFLKKFSL